MRRETSFGSAAEDSRRGGRAALRGCLILAALASCLVGSSVAAAGPVDPPVVIRGAEQGSPITPYVFDRDVRDLPPPRRWQPGDPIKVIPQRFYELPGTSRRPSVLPALDPLLQTERTDLPDLSFLTDAFNPPSRNFAGLEFTGSFPPDTVGDVGPAHYVQMVNGGMEGGSLVRIWDKAEPVPNVVATFGLQELGGGWCDVGFGDPVVTYDRQADRWLMTEMGRMGLCVYVSRTGDPVSGGWYNYPVGLFASWDYAKPAVWATDANGGSGSYVITGNDEDPPVFILNREAMLAGDAAILQTVHLPSMPNAIRFQASTPADADGASAPPAGARAIIMRLRDTEVHDGLELPGDLLEMWLLDVDWQNSDNTTLTQAADIDVADFDVTLCEDFEHGWDGCFPQPDTDEILMALEEIIMHRLQYYRHDDHESLVGNFTIDVDGTDHGGIRWFELRRETGGDWALHQEGTYSIDGDHRWMGSIAMDRDGNIALGYSVTSASTYPGIRYTGRLPADAPGVMTQSEMEIHAGLDSQDLATRWGDYAAMALDPTDDCTFWFTTEYVEATRFWQTQIASFRVESCGSTPATDVLLSESFEAADSFDAWTVVNGSGHDCGDWKRTDTTGRKPTASAGFYALSDSADCRMKSFEIDTSLDSPPLDLGALDVLSVTLELNLRRKCGAGDIATVEAWDGAAWQVIATLPEEEMQTGLTLDVTPYAAGNPAFQVRLRHRTTHKGSWWSADDVTVTAEVSGALAP